MTKEKNDKHYNGQREKEQTLQWPKRKRTNITMTKEKKDKHYPPAEQEIYTIPEHLISTPTFSEVCVTRPLVFCVVICRSFSVILSFFSSVQ
jgi:hypothetical protein